MSWWLGKTTWNEEGLTHPMVWANLVASLDIIGAVVTRGKVSAEGAMARCLRNVLIPLERVPASQNTSTVMAFGTVEMKPG